VVDRLVVVPGQRCGDAADATGVGLQLARPFRGRWGVCEIDEWEESRDVAGRLERVERDPDGFRSLGQLAHPGLQTRRLLHSRDDVVDSAVRGCEQHPLEGQDLTELQVGCLVEARGDQAEQTSCLVVVTALERGPRQPVHEEPLHRMRDRFGRQPLVAERERSIPVAVGEQAQ
jgi:hypothetical protein